MTDSHRGQDESGGVGVGVGGGGCVGGGPVLAVLLRVPRRRQEGRVQVRRRQEGEWTISHFCVYEEGESMQYLLLLLKLVLPRESPIEGLDTKVRNFSTLGSEPIRRASTFWPIGASCPRSGVLVRVNEPYHCCTTGWGKSDALGSYNLHSALLAHL